MEDEEEDEEEEEEEEEEETPTTNRHQPPTWSSFSFCLKRFGRLRHSVLFKGNSIVSIYKYLLFTPLRFFAEVIKRSKSKVNHKRQMMVRW
jgi:hypothetical protein